MGNGAGIKVDTEVVQLRIRQLNQMLDQLEEYLPKLRRMADAQTGVRWTTIPACETFSYEFSTALGEAHGILRKQWREVGELAEKLRLTAESIAGVDERITDQLTRLAQRVERGPLVPHGFYGGGSQQGPYYPQHYLPIQ